MAATETEIATIADVTIATADDQEMTTHESVATKVADMRTHESFGDTKVFDLVCLVGFRLVCALPTFVTWGKHVFDHVQPISTSDEASSMFDNVAQILRTASCSLYHVPAIRQ